jgi:hypothetical protein
MIKIIILRKPSIAIHGLLFTNYFHKYYWILKDFFRQCIHIDYVNFSLGKNLSSLENWFKIFHFQNLLHLHQNWPKCHHKNQAEIFNFKLQLNFYNSVCFKHEFASFLHTLFELHEWYVTLFISFQEQSFIFLRVCWVLSKIRKFRKNSTNSNQKRLQPCCSFTNSNTKKIKIHISYVLFTNTRKLHKIDPSEMYSFGNLLQIAFVNKNQGPSIAY